MAPVAKDAEEPPNWKKYRSIIAKYGNSFKDFKYLKRFDFYERSKKSYLVIATTEPDRNLILKKGVVMI